MLAPMIWLWLMADTARAGVGPWTVGRDDRSVYVGVSASRFSQVAGGADADPLDLGTSVTRLGLDATVTYGLLSSAELELGFGVALGSVTRPDVPACSAPLDPCDDAHGFVPFTGRLKLRLLDEYAGPPLTLSVGPLVRFGDHTRHQRSRFTGLGEGQNDLGGFLTAGRAASLGGAWSLALLAEAQGRYRLPITTIRGRQAPGHEVAGRAEVLIYPRFEVAVGGSVDWVERPSGLDLDAVDFADPDRFTALRTRYVQVGPKLILRSVDNLGLVVSPQFTVLARNAPADHWTLTVGIARFWPSPARTGSE